MVAWWTTPFVVWVGLVEQALLLNTNAREHACNTKRKLLGLKLLGLKQALHGGGSTEQQALYAIDQWTPSILSE